MANFFWRREDGGYNCFPSAKVKVHYKVKHLLPCTRTDESYPMLISYIRLKHLQYFSQKKQLTYINKAKYIK